MIQVATFQGRKVAVFGAGLSGLAAARALMAGGAEVVFWDDKIAGQDKAREAGFTVEDIREADWSLFAALVLSPGVPLTHPAPHWTVEKARHAGVEVIGDTELFCRERRRAGSPGKIAAITGTNGKSTTAALTAHILQMSGRKTALGGNFGTAVLDLPPFSDDMHYVIEYSSFQIDLTPSLDATAACLLNVTPDHLDRHGTIEHYAQVKARIFNRLNAGGTAVISVDDPLTAGIADGLKAPGRIQPISCLTALNNGVHVRNAQLIEMTDGRECASISLAGIGSLRGIHNWQNAAAAYALGRGMGLSSAEIAAGLRTFPGLAHRMEQVGRLGRVLFVNDSKATNVDAAAKALASFERIYWIAGGRPKVGGLAGLEAFYPRICKAYLIGDAQDEFGRTLDGAVRYEKCGTLDAAVAKAAHDASADAGNSEPAVLLSPACASFDHYASFAARGDHFRSLVAALDGIVLPKAAA
jgi:UDP-N-acetylmuramoylalanine--D-glutamate ligase